MNPAAGVCMVIHDDCRHFQGDIPCKPHKTSGVHCEDCPHYDPVKQRILIIKLGAIGDVIRTTPVLHRLKKEYPRAQIHWLTHTPQMVPKQVDRIYKYDAPNIEILRDITFDLLLNLDKDREACALANHIRAAEKKGFQLADGNCAPLGDAARDKWLTGLFDDINQRNTKSYPQEIFEICGYDFQGEEYILDLPEHRKWDLPEGKAVVGLNTGCGVRWKTRLWPDNHWIALARLLKSKGYGVLFLGGEQEDAKNRRLAGSSGAFYPGHFSLPVFTDLMNQCDLIVTAVTMALHIALGLKKKVVLFNNIFNSHEFELYGRGIIVEPPKDCKGCFMNDCPEACMSLILPDDVAMQVDKLMS